MELFNRNFIKIKLMKSLIKELSQSPSNNGNYFSLLYNDLLGIIFQYIEHLINKEYVSCIKWKYDDKYYNNNNKYDDKYYNNNNKSTNDYYAGSYYSDQNENESDYESDYENKNKNKIYNTKVISDKIFNQIVKKLGTSHIMIIHYLKYEKSYMSIYSLYVNNINNQIKYYTRIIESYRKNIAIPDFIKLMYICDTNYLVFYGLYPTNIKNIISISSKNNILYDERDKKIIKKYIKNNADLLINISKSISSLIPPHLVINKYKNKNKNKNKN